MKLKLNHSLKLQYDSLLGKLSNGFVSKDVFVLTDNLLIALGNTGAMQISLEDLSIEIVDSSDELSNDDLFLVDEDSLCNDFLRYVLMVIRQRLKIVPYANEYMLAVLRGKLNAKLKYHNVSITEDSEALFEISKASDKVSIHYVVSLLLNDSNENEEICKSQDELTYAKRLSALNRHDVAIPIYLKLLKTIERNSIVYTEISMYLGEAYYFTGQLTKSVAYYLKCNKEFVKDLNDLYLRIGHSLLDDKMKEYGRYSKIYFRGIINENYKNANVQDWVDAKNKVSEQYEEYESMCVKVGRERM